MKKAVSIFLCALMLLCLAACGAAPAEQGKPADPAGADTTAAVTIDGTEYSAADVDYFYYTIFNTLVQSPYAVYLGISANMDRATALNEIASSALGLTDETMTWDAYLKNESINNLKYVDALNKLAQQDGFALTDELQETLDTELEGLHTAAAQAGMTDEAYLKALYGDNMTEEAFTSIWKKAAVASAYSDDYQASMTFTDADLEAYCAAHANELETVSFEVIFFDGNPKTKVDEEGHTVPATDEEKSVAKEAARLAARDALDRYNAGESLEQIAGDFEIAAYNREEQGRYSTSEVMEWLFDGSRKAEEVTILETDPSCYLLLFHSRERITDRTIDVRHILFLTDASSADQGDAKAKADDALARWKAGEATEESFAALANELSEDLGSNTNGGLYEKVYPGQMVEPFNDWCFDESRKAGDTGVVETSYGFHVMYFSGENVPYWQLIAEDALRSEGHDAWLSSLVENITVTEGPAMENVG